MSKFQQAARLNNAGVNALVEGELTSAVQLLYRTITLMRAEIGLIVATRGNVIGHPISPRYGMDGSVSSSPNQEARVQGIEIPRHIESSFSSASGVDVFKHGLQLVPSPPVAAAPGIMKQREVPQGPESLWEDLWFNTHIYTAAVVFNLALTYHLMASSPSESSSPAALYSTPATNAAKAKKLYAMSLELLSSSYVDNNNVHYHNVWQTRNHTTTPWVIKLACLGNLFHVSSIAEATCSTPQAQRRKKNEEQHSSTHKTSRPTTRESLILRHHATLVLHERSFPENEAIFQVPFVRELSTNVLTLLFFEETGSTTTTTASAA